MTFDVFDVVVTPFPFSDRSSEKKRPALILSPFGKFGSAIGTALVVMITIGRASQWPLDVRVDDLDAAGLRLICVVRMKLATLDIRRVERKLGSLAAGDREMVSRSLIELAPWVGSPR